MIKIDFWAKVLSWKDRWKLADENQLGRTVVF
jgi:hypothetical protein